MVFVVIVNNARLTFDGDIPFCPVVLVNFLLLLTYYLPLLTLSYFREGKQLKLKVTTHKLKLKHIPEASTNIV